MKRGNYRKAVFVVVYRKNLFGKIKYLLLRRKLHWAGWEFPKGGIEKGEKLTDAVKREVREETGQKAINIKGHNFSGKYNYSWDLQDRKGFLGQTFVLFSAEVNGKRVIVDKKEHSGYKWFRLKKALKIIDFPEKKKSLGIVDKFLGGLK